MPPPLPHRGFTPHTSHQSHPFSYPCSFWSTIYVFDTKIKIKLHRPQPLPLPSTDWRLVFFPISSNCILLSLHQVGCEGRVKLGISLAPKHAFTISFRHPPQRTPFNQTQEYLKHTPMLSLDTDCMCLVSYKVDLSLDVFESLRLKPSILSLDGWTLPNTHLLGTPFTSPLLMLYKDTNTNTNKQRLSIRS